LLAWINKCVSFAYALMDCFCVLLHGYRDLYYCKYNKKHQPCMETHIRRDPAQCLLVKQAVHIHYLFHSLHMYMNHPQTCQHALVHNDYVCVCCCCARCVCICLRLAFQHSHTKLLIDLSTFVCHPITACTVNKHNWSTTIIMGLCIILGLYCQRVVMYKQHKKSNQRETCKLVPLVLLTRTKQKKRKNNKTNDMHTDCYDWMYAIINIPLDDVFVCRRRNV